MIESILLWFVDLIDKMGYFGVAFFMMLESSVLPVPSEIVVPPAGYLVYQGKMNMFWVIFSGTIGSLVGAYINYFVAKAFGKKVILGIGKYVGLKEKSFNKAEVFFYKHGSISTFTGRLLPVIRHYISVIAGIAKMSHKKFIFYTVAGAAIWNTILAYIGYFAGVKQEKVADYYKQYSAQIIIGIIISVIIIVFVYIFINKRKNRGEADGNV